MKLEMTTWTLLGAIAFWSVLRVLGGICLKLVSEMISETSTSPSERRIQDILERAMAIQEEMDAVEEN